MTEIEITDPEEAGPDSGPAGGSGNEPPYRSLLVPLVVVPALIVMVLVLVFVLFGAIAGEESSPRQNVERLLHGGANEREQAAFNLVRQFLEARDPRTQDPGAWDLDPRVLPELRRSLEENRDFESPGDVPIPLAVTILLAQMGDEGGVQRLCEMTRLPEVADPDGQFRSYAAFSLGALGGRLEGVEKTLAVRALIRLLDDPDPGLRLVGVIALQSLPGSETVSALAGMLGSSSLEVRGNAALSLAHLGDDAGVDVLRDLIGPEAYATDRAEHPLKWARAERISESRRLALEALVGLGHPPAASELERLAEDDPDGEVRALARRILAETPQVR